MTLKQLLRQINIEFKSFSVDVEEKIKRGEKRSQSVKRLAREKLAKAREKVNYGIIITADTIVVLDSKIIGKPEHKSKAKKFLKNGFLVLMADDIYSNKDRETAG